MAILKVGNRSFLLVPFGETADRKPPVCDGGEREEPTQRQPLDDDAAYVRCCSEPRLSGSARDHVVRPPCSNHAD